MYVIWVFFPADDNIVLREDRNFSPIIIDFGKATRTDDPSWTKYNLTAEEQRRWRIRHLWIAPELLSGQEKPSATTDVYSLGFVIRCVNSKRLIPLLKNVHTVTYVDEPGKRASLSYLLDLLKH